MCTNQRTCLSLYAYNTFLAFMYHVLSYKCKFRVISQYKMPFVSVSNILINFEQRYKIDIVLPY